MKDSIVDSKKIKQEYSPSLYKKHIVFKNKAGKEKRLLILGGAEFRRIIQYLESNKREYIIE